MLTEAVSMTGRPPIAATAASCAWAQSEGAQ